MKTKTQILNAAIDLLVSHLVSNLYFRVASFCYRNNFNITFNNYLPMEKA